MFTDSRDERDIYRSIVTIARAMDERDWTVIEELAVADVTGDLGSGAVNSAAELVLSSAAISTSAVPPNT